MAIKLKLLSDLSGEKATIYTLVNTDTKKCPFSDFLEKWSKDYEDKILSFIRRIKAIGQTVGGLEEYFKMHENETEGIGDEVCALFDEPDKEMRLYCIRISEKIIILGGGGPKKVRTWQECPTLSKAVRELIEVAEKIKSNIKKGSFQYSEDQMRFSGGDLTIF